MRGGGCLLCKDVAIMSLLTLLSSDIDVVTQAYIRGMKNASCSFRRHSIVRHEDVTGIELGCELVRRIHLTPCQYYSSCIYGTLVSQDFDV